MLGIPLLTDYIHKVVKPQDVSDSVDHLNYYCTSLLLAFAALAISAKQYFGSPIQCWVPNEFRGGWEKYAEDYCFIQNSYYVPFEEQIPEELHGRRDQLSYYRWVPIVLALQALMFFAPNFFWNMLYKQTAVQPRGIVKEAQKCSRLCGSQRESEVRNLAEYICDTVSTFSPRKNFEKREIHQSGGNLALLYLCTKLFYVVNIIAQLYMMNHFLGGDYLYWGYEEIHQSGGNLALLYLCTKLFYVVNIIAQLYMMNHFLGGDYLYWGYETMKDVATGKEWTESPIFPRVIMCDFQVNPLIFFSFFAALFIFSFFT
uniref:Innexin n=1 Tax=Ascaris lumbricoides TaxID=6252 RepID=A0A0M3IN94_ASCLU